MARARVCQDEWWPVWTLFFAEDAYSDVDRDWVRDEGIEILDDLASRYRAVIDAFNGVQKEIEALNEMEGGS